MHVKTPPDLKAIFGDFERMSSLIERSQRADFQEAVRTTNERYWHWDDLVHHPLPDGVVAEDLWAFVKLGRYAGRKFVPLVDKEGKPFSYTIQDRMLKALNEVDVWSGRRILTSRPDLPSEEEYVINSLMEEAIASSQLEGASTTRREAKAMLRSGRKPKNHSERMILNNWKTMQYILRHRQAKLDTGRLCEIQALITQGTLKTPAESGRLRTSRDDDVVVQGYEGEVLHRPPKSSELPRRLESLCAFANDETPHEWIHPALKASILHFWIGYDHPFVDGNGRTARAALYWYMLKHGYSLFEYLSISRNFLAAPAQYAKAFLYTETDDGDLTYFLVHNLEVMCQSRQDLRAYLDRKQAENERAAQLLRAYKGLNHRQRALVYHALKHPGYMYKIETQRNTHQIAYETARKDLLNLAKRKLLVKQTSGREFIFLPADGLAERLHAEKGAGQTQTGDSLR